MWRSLFRVRSQAPAGGIRVTSCVDYAWSGARAAVRGIINPGFNTFYTQSPGQLRGERREGAPSPPPGSVRTLTDSGNKHEPLSLKSPGQFPAILEDFIPGKNYHLPHTHCPDNGLDHKHPSRSLPALHTLCDPRN